MTNYKLEVEQMDLRHHRRVKMFTLLGAATFAAVALWAADFRIGAFDVSGAWQGVKDWWSEDWFPEKDDRYAVAPQLPTPVGQQESSPKEAAKPLPGTDSSISKVPLPLYLVRTEPGRNANEGRAFMGTAKENPQTYAAGAILANGARIKEIHRDHVVLERDGKSVKLYVDGSKQNSQALNDMLAVGGQSEQKMVQPEVRDSIHDYILTSPVYEGGAVSGYKVYAGRKSGVFSQLGLQQGDVIKSLNAQPFSDPRQAYELFEQLRQGVAMSAVIERKGSYEYITLDGALITAAQERAKQPALGPSSIPSLAPGM